MNAVERRSLDRSVGACETRSDRHRQTRSFLQRIDPKATFFTIQTFDDTKAKRSAFAKIIHIDPATDTLDRLVELNKSGAGIFFSVNETDGKGRQAQNIVRVRAVFVDLDGAPLSPVLQAGLDPHCIVRSSPGRWHCYWRVRDCPLDQFKRVQQALAQRFSGDSSIHDLPRVMRLPEFLHHKAEPYLSHMLEAGYAGPPYALAEIVSVLRLDHDTTRRESQGASPNAQREIAGQPVKSLALPPNLQPEVLQPTEFNAEKIIDGCQQFAWARDNQPDVPEPTWRAMIGTLYRTDTPDSIYAFSEKYPRYTRAQTEDKAKKFKGGGVRCDFLETQRPAGCVGCPYKGTIRSPSALGLKGRAAGAAGCEEDPEVPEPQNLFETLAPTPLDLMAALPPVLAEFAAVRAGVAGHDPTAYAYAAVAAVSGVIPHDTRVEIGPTWREPLLQWVAEVGPTGSGKSPAMTAAVEPVVALHHAVQAKYKLDRAAWEAAKQGPAPTRSGYYFTDPTIDALIDRAANSQHTVLRHADEGTSWLNAMGRFSTRGDGGERGTWLASWNGAPYTVTRIERGDSSLDAWGVAVLYGITPNKLKEAYADASSDGMLARTLICLTDPAHWVPAQADPNVVAVTARYVQAVRDAAATHQLLTITRRAHARWEALRADYRATALAVAELAPGLSGFLVKAPTMAVRLAGLFAVVQGEVRVRDEHMEWAEKFMRHAAMTARIAHEQVFAVSQPVAIARRLAARILTSGGDRITRREFMRTDAYAKATEAERGAAIDHLAGAGWLIEADTKRVRLGPRFREATAWRVNPLVHQRFAEIAKQERRAAQEALTRLGRLCGPAP
ncbi:MAG: DUF3987 domain-containing protein [Burkholderiales bacterium]|nr:DUF3987 domain-containing protein [Burkholderiales bacterium]